MKFRPSIPVIQTSHYKSWDIEHSPALDLRWLQNLLDSHLPLEDDKNPDVLSINESKLVLQKETDIGTLVAKLYKKSSFMDQLKHSFQVQGAERYWEYAHHLINHHISTPEPLAFLQQTKFGLDQQAWIICRFNEGIDCENYFNTALTPSMNMTIEAIVEMFLSLKQLKLTHGRFKASNILILNNQPVLLNLDNMEEHSNEQKAERLWRLDIERFMENWWERHDIDKQFRLAFLKQGIKI